jgi:hypothetical protein
MKGGIPRGLRLLAAGCVLACWSVACAKIEAPSGGPPDTAVPAVVESDPDSGEVGIRPDTLRIRFSQGMDKRSVRDAFRIVPSLDVESVRWEESTLEVALAQRPDSGTTYTVFLGSGARDRKGNQLPVTTIPFSTGTELAKGSIEAQVLTGRIKSEGLYVFAWGWDASEDFRSTEIVSPLGLAQVAKDGRFRIAQLPVGLPLRLCALFDAGKDGGYSPDDDLWGCADDAIVLTDSLPGVKGITFYLVFDDEPGSLSGTAADSSCIRSAELAGGFARESDSLAALIHRIRESARDTIATDSLLGFGTRPELPSDTIAVLSRIAQVDSLRAAGREDSARCAIPIIIRLFMSDTVLVAETRGTGGFEFRDLDPGVYEIQAFRDTDGNGQPGPGEGTGSYPFPVDLLPGRRITELKFPLEASR